MEMEMKADIGPTGRTSPTQQRSRDRGQSAAGFEHKGVPGYGFWKQHWYGHTHFPAQWRDPFQRMNATADTVGGTQISMPSRQSWMPHIGIRRFSMMAMTELPVWKDISGRRGGHAEMGQ